MRYVHIPKAGSSFAGHVWAYGCPSMNFTQWELRPGNNGSHVTTNLTFVLLGERMHKCTCLVGSVKGTFHHEPMPGTQAKLSVGLFRRPIDRVVSAYHYDLHAHGVAQAAHAAMKAKVVSMTNRSDKLLTFARFVPATHVQTKMVLGMKPSASVQITRSQTSLACQRVEQMLFVGLVECFDESIALFHARFPGSMYPEKTTVYRQRVVDAADEHGRSDAQLLREGGYSDPRDDAVYIAAAHRFHTALAVQGIEVQSQTCNATRSEAAQYSNATCQ